MVCLTITLTNSLLRQLSYNYHKAFLACNVIVQCAYMTQALLTGHYIHIIPDQLQLKQFLNTFNWNFTLVSYNGGLLCLGSKSE